MQTPQNGLGLKVELNFGLDKSGNFILSRKWQPWQAFIFKIVWMHGSLERNVIVFQ